MRVSQILGPNALRDIVNALANRLHAADNFAPDGEEGQVLTSNGLKEPPSFQDIGDTITREVTRIISSGGGSGSGGGGGGTTYTFFGDDGVAVVMSGIAVTIELDPAFLLATT